jgi:hypothetical protein
VILSIPFWLLSQNDLPSASKAMKLIDQGYISPANRYYLESDLERFPTYNWGVGVLLSAQNAVVKLDPSYRQVLESSLEKADHYWNPQGPVPGYDVQPNKTRDQDRYYDDHAWMVLALIESYELTKNPRWLKRAEQSLAYVLSGEDNKLGGGIYWKEREKSSKNTCSNAPSAAACLAVYAKNKDLNLLKKAEAVYAWTKKNLQAPDSLYWDNIKLDGTVEKTKWSYNSALMLRTAKELATITKRQIYRQDADRLEAACIKKWVKPDGTIDDELQFAHLLYENLDPNKFDAHRAIEKMMEGRDSNGYFGHRWGKTSTGKHQLLHQASAIRALATYELRRRRK